MRKIILQVAGGFIGGVVGLAAGCVALFEAERFLQRRRLAGLS